MNFVKQRERAFMSSQKSLDWKLRNKVLRLATSLRNQYYSKKIQHLHTAPVPGGKDKTVSPPKTNGYFRTIGTLKS